ncbi:MAG: insulinase family protein [Winogradskyella sp.]|uniref:insulinase family protein n=1 Tax=Winogradskyella sp. TaxID=1883156 RepID=UPI000F3EC7B1|nr:insulinase family protein [Winogradskyella sp.]RNC88469.1 MAG: insulinase family protein [Winogradskyella sp.]
MKTLKLKIAAFIGLALVTFGVNAQLDRSQMPKAGPEPTINLEKPNEFKLKNGITVMVVENNKLPRVSYQLSIDNKPYKEGDKAGVASILSSMLGNGTTSISKDEFNEEVDFLGANINFGSSGGFGSGLVKYADRIVELMADATINPLLTEEEFLKEKDKLIENLKTGEKSLDAVSGRVGGALSYGKDHVFGEFTTQETVNNVDFQDVLDLYKIRFAPNNAYIVVVGDIDIKTVKKQMNKYFGKWEKVDLTEIPAPELTANASNAQINFVDLPNATQSSISITNNVDLKQSDDDYFAALMANNILGGGGEGYLFKNLREDKGYTYGAYSSLGASRYGVSRFNASAKVRNAVTDSAVVEFLKEIKRIRTEPVEAQTLKNAKAKYVGNFVMALERPQTIANYALNIKRNKLPEDFYANYLENINKVSIEDVQRVANKYFKLDNARVVIVGKGSDVIENLEKVGLPIKYYDKYANATEKPEFNKALPEGITVKSIMSNYLKATGALDNMNNIKSIMTQYEATTPMGAIVQEEKRIDGKTNQSMYVGGNKMVTMVMTQESATANNQPLPENMTNDMKPYAGLFMERNLLDSNTAKLSGTEKVDGKDAYVVNVPGEVVSWTLYYDVESGLKVKEIQTTNMQGRSQTQEALLKDYTEYSGIKFPETRAATMMGQSVEFKLKEVKINEGVTEADFGN